MLGRRDSRLAPPRHVARGVSPPRCVALPPAPSPARPSSCASLHRPSPVVRTVHYSRALPVRRDGDIAPYRHYTHAPSRHLARTTHTPRCARRSCPVTVGRDAWSPGLPARPSGLLTACGSSPPAFVFLYIPSLRSLCSFVLKPPRRARPCPRPTLVHCQDVPSSRVCGYSPNGESCTSISFM